MSGLHLQRVPSSSEPRDDSDTRAALADDIIKLLRRRGAWSVSINVEPRRRRGIPRILACYRGRFLAIEVKALRGPGPTRMQRLALEALDRSGAITLVARTVGEVEAILEDLRRNPPEVLALEQLMG